MVLVECKRLPKEEYSKDYDVFIGEFPATSNVGEVADALQYMQNTRVRLRWMIAAAKQLAKDSCAESDTHHLLGPVGDAERYLDLERAEKRQLCKREELDALVDAFKGGAMILFPEECSGSDATRRLAAVLDNEDISETERSRAHRILSVIDDGATNDTILSGQAIMWWSAKPMSREADLAKYVGKNEKTKITVKLTTSGSSAPPREPVIDTKSQAELMSHYYRKQEEMKKVIEDDDITFGNSEWADSHGLKKQLMGVGSIKYRPR